MTELAIGASNNAVSPTGTAVHVNAKPESAQADQPEATPKVQAVANDLADCPSVIKRVHNVLRRVPAQLASSALEPNDMYRFPMLSLRFWIL